MNYIPGFSNYLQTSVPRYAIGGRVMDGERMMYDEPMMYDTRGYSEPYQYTAPVEQYMPVEQPMMYGGYDMGGYNEVPYGGGGMLPAEQQYLPAVQPMTQEPAPAAAPTMSPLEQVAQTTAPLTPEQMLDRRIAANTRPRGTFITAPLDNLGKGTGFDIAGQGSNLFEYRGGPIRVTDRKGNVLFSGEGPEAAAEAVKFAQNLSNTKGKKASWDIQQGERTIVDGSEGPMRWVSGPTDYKEGKGLVGDIIGTALPLAVMAIPGVGQLGLALKAATAAAAGGMGAAFRDADPLKAAITAGLSAAGGDVIGKALEGGGALGTNLAPKLATSIGTGVGATAGGLATGQNLQDALLSGAASGAASYVSPDVIKALGVGAPASTSTGGGGDSFDGINVAGGRIVSPSLTLGGSPNKIQKALGQGAKDPYDGLSVTGSRLGNAFGANLGSDLYGAPGQDQSAFDRLTDTTDPNEILVKASPLEQAAPVSLPVTSGGLSPDVLAGMAEFEKNPIISEGSKIEQPVTGGLNLDLGVIDRVSGMETYKEPIVVEGSKIEQPEPVSVSVMPPVEPLPPLDLKPDPALTDKKKLGLEEYLRLAGLASGLIGGAAGAGQGQTGTYGGGGTGRLNPIFSAKLPSAGGLGAVGVNRTVRPMTDEDWLTYGTRPERSFFEYAPQTALPTPITTPIPNEPAGPSMYAPEVDNMRFAEGGGAFAAKRGGSSTRTEFAVNGPGTGRSDDIPAVLSDGEYVIDAETVALLGDGSSKAGAKKLDDLRVKVRKHKGQKLAKGRFSANAKKPEAYLSGGRI
jgi:hypothetical protein